MRTLRDAQTLRRLVERNGLTETVSCLKGIAFSLIGNSGYGTEPDRVYKALGLALKLLREQDKAGGAS